MRSPLAILLVVATAAAALACQPRRIPGTQIRDTPENREVYALVESWSAAMNQRDAAAVLALVAPDYLDDAGTPEPEDDLDRKLLEKTLAEDLARVQSSKLSVTLRRIDVQGNAAAVEIFYDSYYRVQTPAGAVPRRDSDLHRLRLRRIDGKWRIASGL